MIFLISKLGCIIGASVKPHLWHYVRHLPPALLLLVPHGGILYQLPASCCPLALVAGELR